MSPEEVLRDLNKLNSVQPDNNQELEQTQNRHSSFNSRNKSLKFNNGLGFKRKRETQGGSLNNKGQHNKGNPRLKEKKRFVLSPDTLADVSMDIIVSFSII